MSEKCPFCGADPDDSSLYYSCGTATKEHPYWDVNPRADDCYERQLAAKEAELFQLRELLGEAVELLNGYEQIRQNVMGAVSLAVAHGITWPQDQIDLAMKTIAGREAFLAKIAKMKEGV